MPDFKNNEQLLELKLLWTKYKLEKLQDLISGTVIYLVSHKYHLEQIEYHNTKLQELEHYIGLDLGDIYKELEALKNI